MHYQNIVLRQIFPNEHVWKAPRPCTKTITSMLLPGLLISPVCRPPSSWHAANWLEAMLRSQDTHVSMLLQTRFVSVSLNMINIAYKV